MTLAKRIIPCLDIKNGRVVKGMHFVDLKDAGDPVALARRYAAEGADELVFLDITASEQRRNTMICLVRDVARALDIPFTVGGGIRSLDDARSVLLSGADKVSLNTAAVKNPSLVARLMKQFGRQCVVVAIDAKRTWTGLAGRQTVGIGGKRCWFEVFIFGGKKPTGLDALEWAKEAARRGAGEILLTSMDADGTQDGYDIALTKAVGKAVRVPVIASGGCGRPAHMLEVFEKANADAALAASIFHYEQFSVRQVKNYLRRNGVPVRI